MNAEDTPIVDFEGRESSDYQGQWVTAGNLKVGHKVLLSNGKSGIINSVETEELDEHVATYNFEVQDYHTYYVGSEGILVHNDCISKGLKKISNKYNKLLRDTTLPDAQRLLCDQAAAEMKAFMISKGVSGEQIFLRSASDFIVSDTFTSMAISQTGMHTGISYAGLVYDNIHAGISYAGWLADFHSATSIIPTIVPF